MGVGAAALALLEQRAGASAIDPASRTGSGGGKVHPALQGFPHHAPKAKRVIYLHMNGGPSQLDLWDYKPGLGEYFDKDIPPSVRG